MAHHHRYGGGSRGKLIESKSDWIFALIFIGAVVGGFSALCWLIFQ